MLGVTTAISTIGTMTPPYSKSWANGTKVLVCGSREWRDGAPIGGALARLAKRGYREVVHGGCRGADKLAGGIAAGLGLAPREELADWKGLGRYEAGRERNRRMLALAPDLVLAFKNGFLRTLERGGTEHMVSIALAAGVPVFLFAHATGWEQLCPTA